MLSEFKAFAFKGNVVDLAVGVIIGAAFGKIVSSLVDNVLMPLVGLMLGGVDLTALSVTIGAVELKYGLFVQSILDFAIVAFVLFLIVRQANRFMAGPPPEPVVPEPSDEAKLLGEIRDLLQARG
ncbi:MAG: large-conductance mechanosensitive channel protein MscL [Ardenticatenales bacterium]|jgi:large conductance mechanosensitive channel|nr:large-conductance mechanosensitive channel protein MscL [Ardenticatenales bacterium]